MKKTITKRALIALIFAFTTISSHAIGLGAWAGYGFALDSTRDGVCNIAKNAGSTCNKGGLSFGGDLWLLGFGPIQLGLGGAYIPIVSTEYSVRTPVNASLVSASVESIAYYAPFTAQLRFDIPVLPIFVGGMAGYSFASATIKTTVNNQSVVISDPSRNEAFTVGAFAGYAFKPIPLVSIDAGARVYFIFAEKTVVQMVPFIGATFAI